MKNIQNTNNVIYIPGKYAGSLHKMVSGYYGSIDPLVSKTLKVRDVVKTWSFDKQYELGLKAIRDFGYGNYIK